LPVGLQIIGPPFSESKIFQVAKLYERDWARKNFWKHF
jgi:Asp-tRNA(Asn)/Glu-tRNA(Gln) amidotransferase A subunit family amidase